MGMIQLRVDDDLKKQATKVFEDLGLDLSTAIRMFLKRSVMSKGVPFSMILDDEPYNPNKAKRILENAQAISEANGNSKMTLEEINEEIRLAREERRKNKI